MSAKENFNEVQKRIQSLSSPTITVGLGRAASILYAAGMPQNKFCAVHIAGTNGKGSAAATLYSIFRKSGYKTLLNTSPHLVDFSERLEIDGLRVSAQKWHSAVDQIEKIIKTSKYLAQNRPNFFEILTCAAIIIASQEEPDIAIFETGMGGRYDATNILGNVCMTVITPIGMDHTEYLGDTLKKIAAEKFAVMRPQTPAVFAGNEKLNEQFLKTASLHSSQPHVFSHECSIINPKYSFSGTKFTLHTSSNTEYSLTSPLAGTFQAENIGIAVFASEILSDKFFKITHESICAGVSETQWQGRMEVLSAKLPLIVDGGHNEHAMRKIAETVRSLFGDTKISIVIAMMKDKEVFSALSLLKDLNAEIYCTEVPNNERTLSSSELCRITADAGLCTEGSYPSPLSAITAAAAKGLPILCCGSLYLVGHIKEHKNELQWL